MSDQMKGDSSPFPGSFTEAIYGAQGGDTFGGMSGSTDLLPTHPEAQSASKKGEKIEWEVRYRQFDLNTGESEDLERVLTQIANDELTMIRQERITNDKDGATMVTLSWAEGTVVKTKKKEKEPRKDEEGKPYKLQQQYPFPEIEDGEYPGEGADDPSGKKGMDRNESSAAIPPRGVSMSDVGSSIQDAFPDGDTSDE